MAGYRTRIVQALFRNVRSWRDWPTFTLLAAGRYAVHPSNRVHTLGRWLLPKSITLRFKRFGPIPVSLNPANLTHLQVLEEFVLHGAYDLDQVPFTPDLVVDCGAHIGLFLRLCHGRYPQVPIIGYEPQPANARLARKAASSPPLALHEAAVGNADGEVVFDLAAFCGYGAVSSSATSGNTPDKVVVPLKSLPDLLKKHAPQKLLLKIDIEGGERELLPAIIDLLPQSCAFFMETHHGEEGWEAGSKRLRQAGFSVTRLRTTNGCVDGYFLRV